MVLDHRVSSGRLECFVVYVYGGNVVINSIVERWCQLSMSTFVVRVGVNVQALIFDFNAQKKTGG